MFVILDNLISPTLKKLRKDSKSIKYSEILGWMFENLTSEEREKVFDKLYSKELEDMYKSLNLEALDMMYSNLISELPEKSSIIHGLYYNVLREENFYMWEVTLPEFYKVGNEFNPCSYKLLIIPLISLKERLQAKSILAECNPNLVLEITINKNYAVIGVFPNFYLLNKPLYTEIIYTSHLSFSRSG